MPELPAPTPPPSPDPADPAGAQGVSHGKPIGFWTPLKKTLAVIALLSLGLHQPILHWALRQTLQICAQRNGYTLQILTSGNLFTHLQVRALQLTHTDSTSSGSPGPTTLESLALRYAEFHYSLPRLLWSGPGECLASYRLEDADLRLQFPPATPVSVSSTSANLSESSDSPSEPPFARQLENWLSQPALYADAVELRRLNLSWKIGNSALRSLRNLDFTAYPDRAGVLALEAFTDGGQPILQSLKAETTYPQRHLTLSKLRLLPNLELTSFQFNASERARGRGAFSTELRFHNQPLQVSCASQRPSGNQPGHFRIEVAASHFAFEEFIRLLQTQKPNAGTAAPSDAFLTDPAPELGEIEWMEAHLRGDPKSPKTWEGEADLRARRPLRSESPPLATELHCAFHGGSLTFDSVHANLDASSASLSGEIRLPPSLNQWDQITGSLHVRADLEDFATLGLPPETAELYGSGHLSADLQLREGYLSSVWSLDAQTPGSRPLAFSQAHLQGQIQAPLRQIRSLQGITAETQATFENPSLQFEKTSMGFHTASLRLNLRNRTVQITSLQLSSEENQILGTGEVALSEHPLQLLGNLEFKLPKLEKLAWTVRGATLSGNLLGTGKGTVYLEKSDPSLPSANAQTAPREASGVLSLQGSKLRWGNFEVEQVAAEASLKKERLDVGKLSLRWDSENSVETAGHIGLLTPHPYHLRSDVKLAKLERLEPLLQQCGIQSNLSGQLTVRGSGDGSLHPPTGQGSWEFLLKNGRWKSFELNEIACSASYSRGEFKATPLRILTPQTRFNAQVLWREGTLRIQEIALQQWGYPALSGYLVLPLEWNESGPVWNPASRLSGQLQAQHLDLTSLMSASGQPGPLTGRLDCGLVIGGSPMAPELSMDLHAQELRLPSYAGLGPSELKLKALLREAQLTLEASLNSPLKTPVQLEAKLPIHLPKLLSGQQSFSELPIEARLQIPKANLAFLTSLWNGFKKFEGTLQLDASLHGSLNAPRWKGSLQLDSPVVHFVSYRFPAIADLRIQLHFDETALHLQQLRGNVGGGTVSAEGTARWTQPGNSELDFRVHSKEMLVVRGRELSLRLDGDLRLQGPWQTATISGQAYSVKSRVIRDIELLPSTVLKRVASPLPTSNPGKPWFTFPRSPFSEWKWDVSLKTRPEDPLLIRGNRLHGTAHADLRLRGTGAAPTLEGNYSTRDLVAFLPFARISVNRGNFWYFPNQPFRTQLDFTAESDVRQHRIRLFLSGTPEAPKVNLSSDPPLPESDLLNLLTTGILPSDTNENGQAMAGRAAAVLFQELSGKLFDYSSNRERPPTLQRFNLNVGAINTRTGHQETTLSYRLSDQFFVIGELGANGDFGGQIKYLIRFR